MDVRGLWAAVALVAGWGFIGVGLFVWSRNPGNRVGSLMAATGFAWFFSLVGFSNLAVFFTLGAVFGSVYLAVAIHMLLAAPTGRVERRGDRNLVAFAYLLTTVLIVPLFFFVDPKRTSTAPSARRTCCRSGTTRRSWTSCRWRSTSPGAAVVIAALVSLVRRWRSATGPEQQLYGPLYAAGAILMIALALTVTYQTVAWDGSTSEIVHAVLVAPFAVVPYVFLFAFVRARMLQGGAVGELVARVGGAPMPGELRDALAEALDDPSLELVYWLPEDKRFVDGDGRRYEPPEEGARRAVSKVQRDGECIAAIVYDASLRDAQDHVRAVGAAAALVLANERLDAQLRAKVGELRQSRERMLEIGLEERRRLERDLHDGAQQRLVSMALNMRLARAKLRDDPGAAERLLDSAGTELEAALEELRELARGIHPAVLSDRGLGTAIETLAVRAPLPVELAELPDERLPEAVELAAYFVVSEALTNVAKYAGASRATVHVARENGRVVVAVEDDGVGGADPAAWHRPARAGRPARGARGPARGRLARRPGHHDQGADPMRMNDGAMRVVVADDSVLLREGVVRLLTESGFEVVAQAGDADDLLRKVNAHKPDVAVVDIRMPPTNTDDGLRAALRIRADHPDTGVLVLSQYVEEGYALELVGEAAGGVGYLLKDRVADVERFVESVKRVAEGGSALDPEVVAQLVGRARRDDPLAGLTPREREVLELMAEGRSNAAIADHMIVTERAVEKHVTSIFGKLDLPPAPEDHRRVLAVLTFLRA